MTPAQISHLFHGGKSGDNARTAAIQTANKRIKDVFDAVCRRYKITPERLLLVPPNELAGLVCSVDVKFRKTGIDANATSQAAKTYLKILDFKG